VSRVYVDTSALFALLVKNDANHLRARAAFEKLRAREATLVCSSYVLVEFYALLGRRVGLDAVAAFRQDFAPLLKIVWVDVALHDEGLDLLLDRGREDLSLVDAVSSLVARRQAVDEVFAYDEDFQREGFTAVS
jgi:predicted nucleic acid-binding protein